MHHHTWHWMWTQARTSCVSGHATDSIRPYNLNDSIMNTRTHAQRCTPGTHHGVVYYNRSILQPQTTTITAFLWEHLYCCLTHPPQWAVKFKYPFRNGVCPRICLLWSEPSKSLLSFLAYWEGPPYNQLTWRTRKATLTIQHWYQHYHWMVFGVFCSLSTIILLDR